MPLFETIIIRHYNPELKIGLQDVRNAWLLAEQPIKLNCTLHQGNLTYRISVSNKRISYRTLKKGLRRKEIIIKQRVYLLPF
jgi:hypothetical protein